MHIHEEYFDGTYQIIKPQSVSDEKSGESIRNTDERQNKLSTALFDITKKILCAHSKKHAMYVLCRLVPFMHHKNAKFSEKYTKKHF